MNHALPEVRALTKLSHCLNQAMLTAKMAPRDSRASNASWSCKQIEYEIKIVQVKV